MTVVNVQSRVQPLRAMRVLIGVTSKADILAFCPRANVGVPAVNGIQDNPDSKDLRWVHVPHNGDLWEQLNNDGDWIVERAPGHFFIFPDTDFHREFVML